MRTQTNSKNNVKNYQQSKENITAQNFIGKSVNKKGQEGYLHQAETSKRAGISY